MLVSSYQDRIERSKAKQKQIVNLLRDEIWTSAKLVSLLLNCSVSAAYKTLNQLESKGVITSAQIPELKLKVWGITQQGQFEAWDNEEIQSRPAFQPSKINYLYVQHHIDLQVAMITASQSGYPSWINGKLLPKELTQRPDAVTKNLEGQLLAIELERTVKSKKRYEVIFSNYLQAIKQGYYHLVCYICPDEIFALRLEKLFRTIESVPVAGKRVSLTDKHRSKFAVYSLHNWPQNQ